jgi:ligand-binding SRPBCC domain-containing protein
MTTIKLSTTINAPAKICFDLTRSIDLHVLSTEGSGEKAINGRLTGLIEEGEYVTWEATHMGFRQRLTTLIIKSISPHYFFDRMTKGPFKSMEHEHSFSEQKGQTVMSDLFIYEVPFGFAGKCFDKLFLRKYMTRLLRKRNEVIRKTAESGKWKKYTN